MESVIGHPKVFSLARWSCRCTNKCIFEAVIDSSKLNIFFIMRINPTTLDPAVSIREKTNLGRIAQIIGPHGGGEWRATIGSFRERKQRPWVLLMLNFVDSAKKVFGAKKENTVSSDGGVIVEAAPVKENDLHWALGKAWEDRVQLAEARLDLRRDASEFLMANLYRVVHSELQGLS